jgi:hypothetical protein
MSGTRLDSAAGGAGDVSGRRAMTRAPRHRLGMAAGSETFNRRVFLCVASSRSPQPATTMEEDRLDWGHEDELGIVPRTVDMDDAEDAVSLGGDEEDEFLTSQSRAPHPPPKSRPPRPDPPAERTDPGDPALPPAPTPALVHALPPKPVLSTVPFVHPSHPSIIEATAMASRADRDTRNGDADDALPPAWEVKYPRHGRGVYYYNIHTQESTWSRPAAPSTLDTPLSTRNGESLIPRVGRPESGDMSYADRHYRPGESARRATQRTHPDPYSPSHTPRARDTPPPRRPPSPNGSYGGGVHSSYREAPSAAPPSAQDHVRAAHGARRDPIPSDTDRRNLPRDTERSSTTSTLSASSPPPTSRARRVCSSRGGGRRFSQTSREALGVERRHPLSCSFLFDFLAWTHGRSSSIPPFSLCLPSFFFRAKVSRLLYAWLSGICEYYPTLLDQAISAALRSPPHCEQGPFCAC